MEQQKRFGDLLGEVGMESRLETTAERGSVGFDGDEFEAEDGPGLGRRRDGFDLATDADGGAASVPDSFEPAIETDNLAETILLCFREESCTFVC